jgi:hypothetical protein
VDSKLYVQLINQNLSYKTIFKKLKKKILDKTIVKIEKKKKKLKIIWINIYFSNIKLNCDNNLKK